MSLRPDDHRRKWDRETYERLAEDRKREEDAEENGQKAKRNEPPVKRELLKQREYKLDFDSGVGQRKVVNNASNDSQSGGFYCKDCDCLVKDSINYLDHINSRKHQKNLGMSMKLERSSLESVKQRFELNKEKREQKKKEYDLESRVRELAEEEEKLKEYRKDRKRDNKRKIEEVEQHDEEQDEMAKIMGFSGFSSKN